MDFCKNPKILIIPVPWEGTVTYGTGTSLAPTLIREASSQIDLHDYDFGSLQNLGINYFTQHSEVTKLNELAKINKKNINELSLKIDDWVFETCKSQNSFVVLLGGEHSISLGGFKNTFRLYNDYCVLHLDAHMDLRKSYLDKVRSHASVFYNLMTSEFAPKSLVQVGLRDFCTEELDFQKSNKAICSFFDRDIKFKLHQGVTWYDLCLDFIEKLGSNVHISLDIDVLQPQYCTGTGTPVAGGMDFDKLVTLIKLVSEKRKIVGVDLVEVSASAGDNNLNANIAMRLLYKLIGFVAKSNKYI